MVGTLRSIFTGYVSAALHLCHASRANRFHFHFSVCVNVKLSPKSNWGFICNWIWVKPSCKCIITTKEALLRFRVVSFSGKLIFNGGATDTTGTGLTQHETLLVVSPRSMDGPWTRALRTLFVYTEFTRKKVFEQLMLAVATPACCRHGRQKVSTPECDLTGRLEERFTLTLLPVRSQVESTL